MDLEGATAARRALLGRVESFAADLRSSAVSEAVVLGLDTERLEPPTISLGIALGEAQDDFGLALLTTAPSDIIEAKLLPELKHQSDRVEILALKAIEFRQGPVADHGAGPLRIGAAVSHDLTPRPGSLGAFCRDRSTGAVGLVSNNHVLAAVDLGHKPDPIYLHTTSGGIPSVSIVARLERAVALQSNNNEVDAAFAVLDRIPDDIGDIGGAARVSGRISVPTQSLPVMKFGRASGLRTGTVRWADFPDVKIPYGSRTFRFQNLIGIHSGALDPFSENGDSGSLVVTNSGDAVGLVMAGGISQSGLYDVTLACPIGRVLELLNVDLLH